MTERSEQLRGAINKLRGVRGVAVEAKGDVVTGVRVLIVPERTSEEVASEVMKLAAKVLQQPLDPGDLQILRPTGDVAPGRRRLQNLSVNRSDEGVTARITLEREGDVLIGEAFQAGANRSAEYHVMITAVLKALGPLLEHPVKVTDAELVEMAAGRVAHVSLECSGRLHSGSAVEKRGPADAFARATLQATDRLLGPTMGDRNKRTGS